MCKLASSPGLRLAQREIEMATFICLVVAIVVIAGVVAYRHWQSTQVDRLVQSVEHDVIKVADAAQEAVTKVTESKPESK